MDYFRNAELNNINNHEIIVKEDFLLSKRYQNKKVESIDLDKSNVLKYNLDNESWFVLRPSGTEPKLKIYAGVIGKSLDESIKLVNDLLESVNELVERVE
jgi:phosphoglucomutase